MSHLKFRRKTSKIFPCEGFLWNIVDKTFIEVFSFPEISPALKNSCLRACCGISQACSTGSTKALWLKENLGL